MESEAHGLEKGTLSENAEAAEKANAARKPKQPRKLMVGSRFYCSHGRFVCIDGSNDNRMMAPLYFGAVKVIFLHVLHPNICSQAEENAQPQRKVDEREEQKGAEEEAETANTRMQVRLSVVKILVH